MRLRFPEGMRSLVDATLTLQGTVEAATLSGDVDVATRSTPRPFDTGGEPRRFRRRRRAGGGRRRCRTDDSAALRRPHQRAVDAAGPEQHAAAGRQRRPAAARHLRSAAALRPRRGRARRVHRSRASATSSRAARSTSTTRRASSRSSTSRPKRACACPARPTASPCGRPARSIGSTLEFSSDPPLPESEVLALLFSDVAPGRTSSSGSTAPTSRRRSSCVRERAARALTGALSSEVGRVVEQTFGVDTFQLTPSLVDPNTQSSRLDPGRARHDRQAPVRPRLPDLLAQPVVVHARSDHPARIRSDRSLLVDSVAQRRRHLRARRPGEATF